MLSEIQVRELLERAIECKLERVHQYDAEKTKEGSPLPTCILKLNHQIELLCYILDPSISIPYED